MKNNVKNHSYFLIKLNMFKSIREFLNSNSLSHPSIVKALEIFINEEIGEVRIVFEYSKLKSLRKVMNKKKLDGNQKNNLHFKFIFLAIL